MSEIETKYQIGVRRFKINWIGIYALFAVIGISFIIETNLILFNAIKIF